MPERSFDQKRTLVKVKVKSWSRVLLLATSWTAAYQAPQSMGFSRQEYWSGVPLPPPTFVWQEAKSGGHFLSHQYTSTRVLKLCFPLDAAWSKWIGILVILSNSYSFLVLKYLSQDNIKTPHSSSLYFLQVWSNLKHKVCRREGMEGMGTRWRGQMRCFLIGSVIWGWGLLCDWWPITVSWGLLPCQSPSHPPLPPPPHTHTHWTLGASNCNFLVQLKPAPTATHCCPPALVSIFFGIALAFFHWDILTPCRTLSWAWFFIEGSQPAFLRTIHLCLSNRKVQFTLHGSVLSSCTSHLYIFSRCESHKSPRILQGTWLSSLSEPLELPWLL